MTDRLPVRVAYAIGAATVVLGLSVLAFAAVILIGATR